METTRIKQLLGNQDYLSFEAMIKEEITRAKDKAFASIGTDKLDLDNANRAKFYQELIDLPRNRISASEINKNKTVL